MLAKPCRRCGKPGKPLCYDCGRALQAARPARQARGYDALYDRNRRIIVARVMRDPTQRCILCDRGFLGCSPSDITAEHLIPLRCGGTSELDNLAPAHAWCNYGWRRKRRQPAPDRDSSQGSYSP